MKKPIAEIRALIELAIQRNNETIAMMKDETNPQCVALRNRVIGENNAFQAVLYELNGRSNKQLYIMAKGC